MLGGSLDNLIRFKLKRIPAPLQRPLQLAAIQGRVVDIEVLEAIAASEHDIALLLSIASAQGILAAHEHSYRFAHDKIREGVIASIDPVVAPALHEQIATAIERVHADTIAEHAAALALHWRDAGTRPDKRASLRGDRRTTIARTRELQRGHSPADARAGPPRVQPGRRRAGRRTGACPGRGVLQRRTDEGGPRLAGQERRLALCRGTKDGRGHDRRSREGGVRTDCAPRVADALLPAERAGRSKGTARLAMLRAPVSHHLFREQDGPASVRVDALPQPGGDGAASSGTGARLRHHLLQHRARAPVSARALLRAQMSGGGRPSASGKGFRPSLGSGR